MFVVAMGWGKVNERNLISPHPFISIKIYQLFYNEIDGLIFWWLTYPCICLDLESNIRYETFYNHPSLLYKDKNKKRFIINKNDNIQA